ncbi:hypothetical protein HMI54_010401 [Coelomomyces lativittatus]|nr:hypothetical protein HMI54_010401 [Coelomomyces lativittatus]KAJ1501708.1 hypothetical protein HMI55_003259 [Coelomomyces lativittatus]KAJ1504150.1 hypothetical protein HMI56_001769 [Coelomomyces lativittatus]
MEFIGDGKGISAPRLKDASITLTDAIEADIQMIKVMWKMYHECHLVHADLSKYNFFYHRNVCYVFDVSQTVDLEHPNAYTF